VPELPDIELYLHALAPRIVGRVLERVRLSSPFLLRSVAPPVASIEGQRVTGLRRLGKRIVWQFDHGTFLVLHLMISGRLRWKDRGAPVPAKVGLAAFDFDAGSLLLTEASPKKRASLYLVRGETALAEHDPGGLEVAASSRDAFAARLALENRTLKRALTDPRLLSGIGNAYSDEILHAARLSPTQLTSNLSDDEIERLHACAGDVLARWTARLVAETAGRFPEKVTAFRGGMAVHGRYGQPCPDCGTAVQRIQYAANECNYCPTCQTSGRLLADRALSRLLGADWPRTLDELEDLRRR
jgi:formamidopyrimidine-DNA glycosylase